MTLGLGFGLSALSPAFGLAEAPGSVTGPWVDLDFQTGLYWRAGEGASSFAALPGVTVSRASAALAENEAGLYSSFASGVPRVTNKGLLVEAAATNHIRNNSMVGATVATPGNNPTNWVISFPAGVTKETLFVGTDAATGLPRIRLRFSGTASAAAAIAINWDAATQVPAVNGQAWTAAAFVSVVAGAAPTGLRVEALIRDSGGVSLGTLAQASMTGLTVGAPATRLAASATIANASVAYVQGRITTSSVAIGVAVDLTIDIIAPQLEQALSPSAPILTTSASASMPGDNIYIDLPSALDVPATLFIEAEIEVVEETATRYLGNLTKTDNAERLRLLRAPSGAASARSEVGGSAVLNTSASGKTGLRVLKMAVAHDGTDYRVSVDGVTVTGLTGAGPTGMSRLYIGSLVGGSQFNGWIRKAKVWRRALSQSDLNAVTT